jgi:hypothetical protein
MIPNFSIIRIRIKGESFRRMKVQFTNLQPISQILPNMRYSVITSILPLCVDLAYASVTVYNNYGVSGAEATSTSTAYSGYQAFNPLVLDPPPVPSPAPSTKFALPLKNGDQSGLSIPQNGSFFGFSIEFSVTNQIGQCIFNLLHVCIDF